jgi:geranylgeranyl diphosphate synthase type I
MTNSNPDVVTSAAGVAARVLADARSVVEPAHRAAVETLPAELRHIAGYHAGWWDAEGRPCNTSGKAIRPALALACARAVGIAHPATAGEAAPAGTTSMSTVDGSCGAAGMAPVDAAVAVELLHDFSLLHDDVMDGDLTRRHRPASWAVFGVGAAILTGDALVALAMEQLGAGEPVRILARALGELCEGQSADLALETRSEVTVRECVAMAEGKTGALLGAACQLGALAGGAEPAVADYYRTFGRQLGLAFQLVDDLLGIWGDPAVTGKPTGSDLASRKKSFPVVAALTSGTPAGEQLARLYQHHEHLDEHTLGHAAMLVEQAGGRRWTQAETERRIQAALDALAHARPEPGAEAELRALADLITRRDR